MCQFTQKGHGQQFSVLKYIRLSGRQAEFQLGKPLGPLSTSFPVHPLSFLPTSQEVFKESLLLNRCFLFKILLLSLGGLSSSLLHSPRTP